MLRRFQPWKSSVGLFVNVVDGVPVTLGGRGQGSSCLITISPLTFPSSPGRRHLSLSSSHKKNFKYKPERPKLKIHTYEELFGDPKGWSVPPGAYVLLIIPVATLFLGIWQVYRWRWKLEVIEGMENIVRTVPVNFPVGDLESLEDMEYRKVKLRGTFDYTNEVLMGPRQLYNYATDIKPTSGSFMGSGTSPSGYHVITPFHLEGHNMSILVNRGWISDRVTRKYKSTEETVEIVGVVRKEEKRQPFMPKQSGAKDFFIFRDVTNMAQSLKTEPVFLDLVSISGLDLSSARLHNLPVPGQTRVTLRNEHVSYFCTWFTLSAITSYMWYRRFILRRPLR